MKKNNNAITRVICGNIIGSPYEFKGTNSEETENIVLGYGKKTIVYLHGYGSSSQSGTVAYLKKKMPECNEHNKSID